MQQYDFLAMDTLRGVFNNNVFHFFFFLQFKGKSIFKQVGGQLNSFMELSHYVQERKHY